MLQYSTYSVISPEGCAAILWKSNEKAPLAAEAMGITSQRLIDLGLIDEVVPEPLGGAHRNPDAMADNLRQALKKALDDLTGVPTDRLLEDRYKRLMRYGQFG
jgi:acetyl-CoA carboxylase carboxyl transferase subunit alpha